ncbi:MAG: hypothetical protein H0X02_03400 [Nitrosomonas sp.]|nr:hypothetical protein [Nitrosomonas sp.]
MKERTNWIDKRILELGYASRRQFAFEFFGAKTAKDQLSASPMMTRILSGERRLSYPEEVIKMADLLKISVGELTNRSVNRKQGFNLRRP